MLIDQWMIYQSPEIKKNTTVSTDPDKRSTVQFNLDVDFPNTPCFMIDVLMKTTVNEMDKGTMIKSLRWSHIDQAGKTEQSFGKELPFPEFNTSDSDTGLKIVDFLKNGTKCNVKGSILVTKVTGQLAFRIRGETPAFNRFLKENTDNHAGKYQL